MGYVERLLADGERIVTKRRQHWLAPLLEGTSPLALLVVGLLLGFGALQFKPSLGAALYQILSLVSLAFVAIGLLWFGYRIVAWQSENYLVTTRRVIKVEGIVNKRAADSSLEKINDAVLEESVLGRMLGFGDLTILTAAEFEVDRFTMLAHARDFKRDMLNAKYALESDMSHPAPASPPIRADDLTREQATDTLARLAQLRDSGAITPEDYETKKRELLAKI
jgi:uncharacterized membrane protein YdbT with pleckstrin-like domain